MLARGLHKGRSRHTSAHPSSRSGRRSSLPRAQPLHAKTRPLHAKTRSPHVGRAGEPDRTVVVAQAPSPSAATIASVLATPCQDTEAIPTAANLEVVEATTMCLVNQERARSNELPLRVDALLARAAQRHNNDMVEEDYFEHIAPDGETPFDRVSASGYIPNSLVGYTIGENIAWGTLYLATPSSIVAAWIASPEHLANILDADYRDTAIAVAPVAPPSLADGQAGAVYTQEFGVIRG